MFNLEGSNHEFLSLNLELALIQYIFLTSINSLKSLGNSQFCNRNGLRSNFRLHVMRDASLAFAHVGILNHGTPQYLSIALGQIDKEEYEERKRTLTDTKNNS
jgi:hypothetical protein